MLNIDRLIGVLRGEIRLSEARLPDSWQFDMSTWYSTDSSLSECGTASCIGGTAQLLAGCSEFDIMEGRSLETLRWILEETRWRAACSEPQAAELFYPMLHEGLRSVTAEQAALVLEHLRDTGRVDWTVAGADPYPYPSPDAIHAALDELDEVERVDA